MNKELKLQEQGRSANPASAHNAGVHARRRVEGHRKTMCASLNVSTASLTFHPSATSAHLTLCRAVLTRARQKKISAPRIAIFEQEHSAFQDQVKDLCALAGVSADILPADSHGRLMLEDLRAALTPDTVFVSVQAVNSETGVLQPVREVCGAVREYNAANGTDIFFHTDATQAGLCRRLQAFTKMADAFTFNSSKIHGPDGIAALCVSAPAALDRPIEDTVSSVPLVAGFAEAFKYAQDSTEKRATHIERLRSALLKELQATKGLVRGIEREVSSVKEKHLTRLAPNIICIEFPDAQTEYLVALLNERGFAVSAKTACQTHNTQSQTPGLRVSFSEHNTLSSVSKLAAAIHDTLPLAHKLL